MKYWRIDVHVSEDLIAKVDEIRRADPMIPTRQGMIRRLIEDAHRRLLQSKEAA